MPLGSEDCCGQGGHRYRPGSGHLWRRGDQAAVIQRLPKMGEGNEGSVCTGCDDHWPICVLVPNLPFSCTTGRGGRALAACWRRAAPAIRASLPCLNCGARAPSAAQIYSSSISKQALKMASTMGVYAQLRVSPALPHAQAARSRRSCLTKVRGALDRPCQLAKLDALPGMPPLACAHHSILTAHTACVQPLRAHHRSASRTDAICSFRARARAGNPAIIPHRPSAAPRPAAAAPRAARPMARARRRPRAPTATAAAARRAAAAPRARGASGAACLRCSTRLKRTSWS